ncbi:MULTISPECIES: DUF4229 domain-containing protein [unclassified Salinibacterium]|uniref:DUF4229 domain-containing protein n=1 Tax=unclassified Salinibacterium TaxID=2632331 RepID=UPI0018CEEF66|nr:MULTISPECIES: DUF4229 domain-containing protein [unclassified Salinibacterium]MBH0055030.1 DUF4229 domain-containing protein [Salinibacterium sp. SWN139]MBH0083828.1 DUF4229 domain-containing protein [Salinibacterium sp. SWN167]
MKPWISYSLLRVGVFAAAFTVLMIANVEPWIAALIAAILGFAISYVFFSKLRDAVALDLASRRGRPSHDPDRDAEDAAVDHDAAEEQADAGADAEAETSASSADQSTTPAPRNDAQ